MSPEGDASERARLDELRRLAFGRTRTPADERAAAAAQLSLHRREQAAIEDAAALGDRGHPSGVSPRRPRERWLSSGIVASVAGAAVAAVLVLAGSVDDVPAALPAPTARPAPTKTATLDVPAPNGPGNVVAAAQWFLTPRSPDDAFPHLDRFDSIDPDTTRLVPGAGSSWSLWVAATTDGRLCLLTTDTARGNAATACVPQAAFTNSGLTLTYTDGVGNRFGAYWDGNNITRSGD